jgi:hypothetical protein
MRSEHVQIGLKHELNLETRKQTKERTCKHNNARATSAKLYLVEALSLTDERKKKKSTCNRFESPARVSRSDRKELLIKYDIRSN